MVTFQSCQSTQIMYFVDGAEIDIAFYDTLHHTKPAKAGSWHSAVCSVSGTNPQTASYSHLHLFHLP